MIAFATDLAVWSGKAIASGHFKNTLHIERMYLFAFFVTGRGLIISMAHISDGLVARIVGLFSKGFCYSYDLASVGGSDRTLEHISPLPIPFLANKNAVSIGSILPSHPDEP